MIEKIKSKNETGTLKSSDDLSSFISSKLTHFNGESFALIHLQNKVFFEKISNKTIPQSFSEITQSSLRELRIFNPNAELHLWNLSYKIGWRLRLDTEGEETEISDKVHILWGNKINDSDPTILREEGKGCEIKFHSPVSKEMLPLKMTVRNYIAYDEDGLLYFNDARIINIKIKEN